MLNAVWVAVIIAAAFWVIGVCAAVYVMVKAARLMSQTMLPRPREAPEAPGAPEPGWRRPALNGRRDGAAP